MSFDRAADYYDATRRLPGGVAGDVADVLSSELAGKELCLEIGVGTGRVALPLAERGINMIGIDLAPAMLARLVANAGGRPPFSLVTADGTALPLAGGSVDAVVGCHVLHLIPDWQTALDEADRILRPGGLLVLDFGGPTPKPWSNDFDAILEGRGVPRIRPGVSSPDLVAGYLAERALDDEPCRLSTSQKKPAWPKISKSGRTRSCHGPGPTPPSRCAPLVTRSELPQNRLAGPSMTKSACKR